MGARSQGMAGACSCREHRGTAHGQQCPVRSLGTGTSCSFATWSPNAGAEQRVVGGWWGLGEFLWIRHGPMVGTHLSLCVWHPVVAGQCHGQQQWLGPPCPAQAMVWWHQGTPGGSFSVCSWTGDSHQMWCPQAGGLTASLQGLHQGSITGVTVLDKAQAVQDPHRQGTRLVPWQEWQWPLPVAAPVLLRLFLGMCMCMGFARSCFLLSEEEKIPKTTPEIHPLTPAASSSASGQTL